MVINSTAGFSNWIKISSVLFRYLDNCVNNFHLLFLANASTAEIYSSLVFFVLLVGLPESFILS